MWTDVESRILNSIQKYSQHLEYVTMPVYMMQPWGEAGWGGGHRQAPAPSPSPSGQPSTQQMVSTHTLCYAIFRVVLYILCLFTAG